MNTFTSHGLTLPDCACFNKQAEKMNASIDHIIAIFMVDVIGAADALNICEKSLDYYIAACIWGLLSIRLKQKENDDGSIAMYRQDFEDALERLKPLIMQRIDYADGVMQNVK